MKNFLSPVYLRKITTKMGMLCLAVIAVNSARIAAQEISPLSMPKAALPPQIPADQEPGLRRRQDHQQEHEKENRSQAQQLQEQKEELKQEQIKAEAEQLRPLYGFLEISLVYPKVVVSGSRKDYHADVTSHVNAMSRIFSNKDAQSIQPWAGLRIAPFGGTGTQKGHRGRFALTYFGPAFGFGRVSALDHDENDKDSTPVRNGWLISAGLAAVTRSTRTDEPETSHATDFQSSGWSADPPGLWLEGRFMHITRGAIGFHGIAGVQTAQGKTFAYVSGAIAGYL